MTGWSKKDFYTFLGGSLLFSAAFTTVAEVADDKDVRASTVMMIGGLTTSGAASLLIADDIAAAAALRRRRRDVPQKPATKTPRAKNKLPRS